MVDLIQFKRTVRDVIAQKLADLNGKRDKLKENEEPVIIFDQYMTVYSEVQCNIETVLEQVSDEDISDFTAKLNTWEFQFANKPVKFFSKEECKIIDKASSSEIVLPADTTESNEISFEEKVKKLTAILCQIGTSLKKNKNRWTSRGVTEKRLSLSELAKNVAAAASESKLSDYISQIREVCGVRRHCIHFWSKPNSLKEFNLLIAADLALSNIEQSKSKSFELK